MRKRAPLDSPMADLVAFYWRVPEGGFEWTKSSLGDVLDSALTIAGDVSTSRVWHPYEPLETPGLFLEFAHTPPTLESALAFANKRGALGFDPTRQTQMTHDVSKPT